MAFIGEPVDLSYPYEHLGEGADALAQLLEGGAALERLRAAERPAVIVGPGLLARPDRAAVLQQARPGRLLLRLCEGSCLMCEGRRVPGGPWQPLAPAAPASARMLVAEAFFVSQSSWRWLWGAACSADFLCSNRHSIFVSPKHAQLQVTCLS